MKLATCLTQQGPTVCYVRETEISRLEDLETYEFVPLVQQDASLPGTMRELLAADAATWRRVQAIGSEAPPLSDTPALLPPIPDAQKIICVGLNYADHAKETGAVVGEEPVIFNKLPSTLIAHNDAILLPPESQQIDYEAELVVVIGKRAKRVSSANWQDYVAGFTCGNDVSSRDWQKGKPGGQWLLGKSFDTFAPTGPFLVTADEVPNPGNLAVQLKLNGEVMQNSRTDQLIFDIGYLVSYFSKVFTLEPGDLIFTGTPSGVGAARNPQVFMQSGDEVEVSIEGIGLLRNRVAAC